MKKDMRYKGIAIMLCSSLMTCSGQLCWKLASGGCPALFLILGFAFYGCGALLMILALRFGDLSTLHPMLGFGYVLSVVLGQLVLQETVGAAKVMGILVIIVGLIFISMPERERG